MILNGNKLITDNYAIFVILLGGGIKIRILDKSTKIIYKILTTNFKKTMIFYLDLGFETILRTFNKQANEQVAFLQFKDIVIKINETLNAKGKVGTINYISINIFDIEKAFKESKIRGYDLLNDEVQYLHLGGKGIKFFTLRGPSEEKIELYQKL